MMGPAMGINPAMATQSPMLGNQPMTVQELNDKAVGIAQTVLGWPDPQRRSYLANLKRREPQLHAIVSSIVEDERRKAEVAGRDAVLQQQYGAA